MLRIDRSTVSAPKLLQEMMGPADCMIALYARDNHFWNVVYASDDQMKKSFSRSSFKGLWEYVARTGRSIFYSPENSDEILKRTKVEIVKNEKKSWIGVPLIVNDKPIGVVSLQEGRSHKKLSSAQMHIIEYIAPQLAKEIEYIITPPESHVLHERYKTFVDDNPTPLFTLNAEGILQDANTSLLELLKCKTMKDAVRATTSLLGKTKKARQGILNRLQVDGTSMQFAMKIPDRKKRNLTALVNLMPIKDIDGKIVRIHGVLIKKESK